MSLRVHNDDESPSNPRTSDPWVEDRVEETRDPLTLPLCVTRALHRHLALALSAVRSTAPFDALNAGQRSIVSELLCGWAGGHAPNQADVVRATGLSVRFVRDALLELEEALVVSAVRQPGKSASYGAGLLLERCLRDFAGGLDVNVWRSGVPAKAALSASMLRTTPAPGAGGSATTPARGAGGSETTPARGAGGSETTPALGAAGSSTTPAPGAAGSSTTPAPGAAGSETTPAPGAGGSATTPAPGAGVARMRDFDRTRAPTPIGLSIGHNLQRIRVSPSEPTAAATSDSSDADSDPAPSDSPFLIKKKILNTLSSFPEKPPDPATPPTTPAYLGDAVLRAAALRALITRYKQGLPDRPLPRTFAAEDIETVVRVTTDWTGSEAELDQEHLDAIAGATQKSKAQPPSVRFIWGDRDHFFRNAREVRRAREAANAPVVKRTKKLDPALPPATCEQLSDIGRNGMALLDRLGDAEAVRLQNSRCFPNSNPSDSP